MLPVTTTIALAGKGGVGKTTVAALLIKFLIQMRSGSILAIDADPSSNLNMLLGVNLDWTVGDIREEMLGEVKRSLQTQGAAIGTLPHGMLKRDYLDYEIRSSVAEADRFDLIAMGRSEGPGCYCAVNHHLREVVDAISSSYRYVVIDNEAGMEHLSRRTTRDVQLLLVVSDVSLRGIIAAGRIAAFRHAFDINIENAYLILNGLRGDTIPDPLLDQIGQLDIPLLGTLPHDDRLFQLDIDGRPVISIEDSSPVYRSAVHLLGQLLC